ncbi:hypothetical protein B0H19DRAFT_952059 [Mycena capillaripes]|nr:hypothetical protein B0H19DRAFT_952059 [Mycena capillaripes]
MLTVPRISSALATVVIETFFYGIYLVLFLTSIYLLFTAHTRGLRRERSVWVSPILCGGSVLFIAVTGHWVLTIDRLFLAFVTVDNGADPLTFYGDYSQPSQIIQGAFLLVSLAIADGLMVHRLWTVYTHNRYVMIFPALMLLGLLASTIGVVNDFSHYKPGDSVLDLANGWIIADSVFTVFVLKPIGGPTLNSIIAIIVESAGLTTTWAIFFIITYATRSNLRFLIDVTPAIVGTANMLIYVRVGLGWAHAPATRTYSTAIPIRFNNLSSKFDSDHMDEGRDLKQAELVWYVFQLSSMPWRLIRLKKTSSSDVL